MNTVHLVKSARAILVGVTRSGWAGPVLVAVGYAAMVAVATAVLAVERNQGYDNELFPGDAVVYAALASTVLLWPVAGWAREAPTPRLAVSVAIALTVLVVGATTPLWVVLVGVALFPLLNITAVFGPTVGGAYGLALAVIGALVAVLDPYVADAEPLAVHVAGQLLACLVIYGSIVVAVTMTQSSRRRRDELARAHAELQAMNLRIRDLTLAAERERFARDMHDSMGHHLTAILLGARRIRSVLAERGPGDEVDAELAEVTGLARRALTDARRTVRALPPAPVESGPMEEALATLVETRRRGGLDVRLEVDGDGAILEPAVRAVLYRTVQEGLTNAVRHATPTSVVVTLAVGVGVELTVRNDGVGPENLAHGHGAGLAGLRDRVREVGGHLEAGVVGEHGFELRVVVASHAPDPG